MGEFDELTQQDRIRLLASLAGPHGIPPTHADPVDILVVFGCDDPRLAHDAAALFHRKEAGHVVFSGGVGKDSGGLVTLDIPEGIFLASVAIAAGMPSDAILIEKEATNGAQNAAFALRLATERGLLVPGSRVASLAPAPRSRRLFEELRFQAADIPVRVTAGLSTGAATVDLNDPAMVRQLLREIRGLHTMHESRQPRIFPLPEYQTGGKYSDLVKHAVSAW